MTFHCKICNYFTLHKGDWNKHQTTIKHLRMLNTENTNTNIKDIQQCFECICGKLFKFKRTRLRHQKVCSEFRNSNNTDTNETLTEAVKTLVAENHKLSEQLKCLVPKNDTSITTFTNTSDICKSNGQNNIVGNNNSITNNYVDYKPNFITAIKDSHINMKVYLDQHCNEAINLSSFIETLQLNNSDLDETRERGLAYSLGKVLLRGLRELDLNKRPIHCSNLRKSVMYIRDNNEWDVDTKETQLRDAISILSSKQIEQIKEWEKEHPDWEKTEKGTQAYTEIVRGIFKMSCENEKEKVENKVIKTIAKETLLSHK